jgi:DNA-binding LacI/PurR family transcriptional regulator
MRDIARAAGVPVSAVPLVLANKPGVSVERRARVQAVAKELGYERPQIAWKQTRRHRLGLVIEARAIPILTDFYYGEVLVGIQAEARRLGLSVWLHAFDAESDDIADIATTASNEVDGLIIVSGGSMTDERIVRLESTRLPTVLVDNFIVGHAIHAIVADNYGAGAIATQYLLDLGHRRVAIIAGARSYRKFAQHVNGYADALSQAGIASDARLQPPPVQGEQHPGESQMQTLLSLPRSEQPTAVVLTNDRLATRALRLLQRTGVNVPEQMSVVGIGDTDDATSTSPRLTTIAVPRSDMGILAVRRLADLLAGTALPPSRTELYVHLVVRESSGPPPHA